MRTEYKSGLTELGEEPPVLSAVVTLLKKLLDGLAGLDALSRLLEALSRDNLLEVNVQVVPVSGG